MEACMPVSVALSRSCDAAGNVSARLGLVLTDVYLEFLHKTAKRPHRRLCSPSKPPLTVDDMANIRASVTECADRRAACQRL
jgi:hypothetical protein